MDFTVSQPGPCSIRSPLLGVCETYYHCHQAWDLATKRNKTRWFSKPYSHCNLLGWSHQQNVVFTYLGKNWFKSTLFLVCHGHNWETFRGKQFAKEQDKLKGYSDFGKNHSFVPPKVGYRIQHPILFFYQGTCLLWILGPGYLLNIRIPNVWCACACMCACVHVCVRWVVLRSWGEKQREIWAP